MVLIQNYEASGFSSLLANEMRINTTKDILVHFVIFCFQFLCTILAGWLCLVIYVL